jgi:hypothetical protein
MNGLPECDEFFEMRSRGIQDLSYIGPFGADGPDSIHSIGQGDIAISVKIDDGLHFARKAVNMAWRMVVRVGDELDSIESQRAHGLNNPSRMGLR